MKELHIGGTIYAQNKQVLIGIGALFFYGQNRAYKQRTILIKDLNKPLFGNMNHPTQERVYINVLKDPFYQKIYNIAREGDIGIATPDILIETYFYDYVNGNKEQNPKDMIKYDLTHLISSYKVKPKIVFEFLNPEKTNLVKNLYAELEGEISSRLKRIKKMKMQTDGKIF